MNTLAVVRGEGGQPGNSNHSYKKMGYTWPMIVDKILFNTHQEVNVEFKDWLLTKESIGEANLLFGSKTYYFCFNLSKKLLRDIDNIVVIVGTPGIGKSTLGYQLASIVSPSFSRCHCIYTLKQLIKALKISKPGETLVIDEAVLILFSRMAMQDGNKAVVSLFMQIRQLRLNIVLCIPEFKHVDSYIRESRVNALFNIYTKGKFDCIFGRGIKIVNEVYPKSKKFIRSIRVPSECFYSDYYTKRFPKINDIDESWYRSVKKQNLIDVLDSFLSKTGQKPRKSGSVGREFEDTKGSSEIKKNDMVGLEND